jgi:hypothetical protein
MASYFYNSPICILIFAVLFTSILHNSRAQNDPSPVAPLPVVFNATTCAELTEDQVSSLSPKLLSALPVDCLPQLNYSCAGLTADQLRGA